MSNVIDFAALGNGDRLVIQSHNIRFDLNIRRSEPSMVPGQTGLIVIINSISGIDGYTPRKSAMLLTANLGDVTTAQASEHFWTTWERCTSIGGNYWACLMQGRKVQAFRITSFTVQQ